MDRSWHKQRRPHRRLRRGHRGEDVKAFQRALNARMRHVPEHLRRAARRSLVVDGVFGGETLEAWREVRWAIGLPGDHPPTRVAQLNVRKPATRSPVAKRRARQRRRGAAPRIITASQLGLRFAWVFGETGPVYRGSAHYSAGPRAPTGAELVERVRSFHRYHADKGWGGISYNALVADDGTIVLANPVRRKGAMVAGQNTGMVGICVPGTTGDRLTPACIASIRYLLDRWHTREIPAEHRLARPARQLEWRVHREWPGQATACPGDMTPQFKELLP